MRRTQSKEIEVNNRTNMGMSKTWVFVVVAILGVAAAVFAFAAEATRLKVSDMEVTRFKCSYPSNPANILGYIAMALSIINQIAISSVVPCCCSRGYTENVHTRRGVVCLSISWVGYILGVTLLSYGAGVSTRQQILGATRFCIIVQPGIFAAGGVCALVAGILGLCSYKSLPKHHPQLAPVSGQYNQDGIAMGNPHFSATSGYTNFKQQQYV